MKNSIIVAAITALAMVACAGPKSKEVTAAKPKAKATKADIAFEKNLQIGTWLGKCYQSGSLNGSMTADSQRYELTFNFGTNGFVINKVQYPLVGCSGTASSSEVVDTMKYDLKVKKGETAALKLYDVIAKREGPHEAFVRGELVAQFTVTFTNVDEIVFGNVDPSKKDFLGMDETYVREVTSAERQTKHNFGH